MSRHQQCKGDGGGASEKADHYAELRNKDRGWEGMKRRQREGSRAGDETGRGKRNTEETAREIKKETEHPWRVTEEQRDRRAQRRTKKGRSQMQEDF